MNAILSFLALPLLATVPIRAALLDQIDFGAGKDQPAHELATTLGETYAGDLGQSALRFLPKNPVDYYGGEATFRMRVDSGAQNYFTAKFSGDEFRADSDNGRMVLKCESGELGMRHGSDEGIFLNHSGAALSPGAFYYRTVPIPMRLTRGKSTVTFKLQATGRFFDYGTPWDYATYQRKLLQPTRGAYRAYTHTNPYFDAPAAEVQGGTADYAAAPRRVAPGAEKIAEIKSRCNARINALIAAAGYLKHTANNNYNDLEYLALAYAIPWTAGYRKPALLEKVAASIDSNCAAFGRDSAQAKGAWGGAYGRLGYAIHLLAPELSARLGQSVDLGKGAKPRREYWFSMLKASYDHGRMNRMTIANQELECDMSLYGAYLGMRAVDSSRAAPAAEARRYLLEAAGLAEYRGSDLPGGGSAWSQGHGYYMMTTKGTSHEPGWVSQDCYGNLGPKLVEISRMLGGDTTFLRRAVELEKMQAYFRYPSVDQDGNRAILAEGVICWRNAYHPGKLFYGCPWVAAASSDPQLLGFQKQMLEDNQFFQEYSHDYGYIQESKALFLPEAYEKIAAASSTVSALSAPARNPCTPGQPDYAAADEQNGIVAVKRGGELFFIMLYRRAYAINYLAMAHHVTARNERVIEFTVEDVRFTASGKSKTRGVRVQSDFTGTPPDNPESAYKGQVQPIPALENGDAANDNRAIAEFYGCVYGNYRIGMNCTRAKTFDFSPPGFVSGLDLVSGRILTAPIRVGPQSTVVLYAGTETGLGGGVPVVASGFQILPMRNPGTLAIRLSGGLERGASVRLYSPQGRRLLEREGTGPLLTLSLRELGGKLILGEVRGEEGRGGGFRIVPGIGF